MKVMSTDTRLHLTLLLSGLAVFIWSMIAPRDVFTWALEVLPAAAGGVILVCIYQKFRFTTLAYGLIWIATIMILIGGHYTYAEMPLFNWLRDIFDLGRNHYDRLGHFVQGFVPAIIVREVLLRKSPLRQGKWLFAIVVSICLAISALYELFEWAVAVVAGTAAEAFLGTQGDVWDTQWDMFLALCGAVTSLSVLSGSHNRALQRLALPAQTDN